LLSREVFNVPHAGLHSLSEVLFVFLNIGRLNWGGPLGLGLGLGLRLLWLAGLLVVLIGV
jgi:hypothetical protein